MSKMIQQHGHPDGGNALPFPRFSRRWGATLTWMAPALALVLTPAGCASPASLGSFDSPDPASRLYAIHRAGESRDHARLGQLIEQLDSDDPAARMMAISALDKIHGDRMGYSPYAQLPQRQKMVDRWVHWYRQHKEMSAPESTRKAE